MSEKVQLDAMHLRLLRRGVHGTYIGLANDAAIRSAEIAALSDLHRWGLATYAAEQRRDGPPRPRSSVITDKGRTALAEMEG